MHFGVLAAGKGKRMAREGVCTPKPLVRVGDIPLVDRIMESVGESGSQSLTVVTDAAAPQVASHISEHAPLCGCPVTVVPVSTASPVESLAELLDRMPSGKVIIATTDSLFPSGDLRCLTLAFDEPDSPDAIMAVTEYVEDRSPLFVHTRPDMSVSAFSSSPAPFVSAGVYALGPRARLIAKECFQNGATRLRQFQQELLDRGLSVKAKLFGTTFDIDTPADIISAEVFYSQNL